jgi:hypothetical protein
MIFALFVLVALLGNLAPVAGQGAEIRFPLPEDSTPIALGETLEAELGGDTQAIAFSFEGEEGQGIQAYAIADEDSTALSLYMYLLAEDGEVLNHEQISFINLDYDSYIPLYVLPDTGAYSIIVTSSDNAIFGEAEITATFSFSLAEPKFQTLSLGDTVEGTLEPVEGTDYSAAIFYLEGARAELPYFIFEAPVGVDLTVEPLSSPEPDTFEPNRASDGISYLGPLFNFQREQYVIVAHGFLYGGEPIEFSLRVEGFEPAEIAAGETVAVEINIQTLRNYAKFEAKAGDEATITLSATEATNPAVVLFDPVGRVAGFDDTGAGLEELELLEDGTYVIMVFPQADFMIEADQLGEVEITLDLQ